MQGECLEMLITPLFRSSSPIIFTSNTGPLPLCCCSTNIFRRTWTGLKHRLGLSQGLTTPAAPPPSGSSVYTQAAGMKNAAGQSWDDASQAAYQAWLASKTSTQQTWDEAKRVAYDTWTATADLPTKAVGAAKVSSGKVDMSQQQHTVPSPPSFKPLIQFSLHALNICRMWPSLGTKPPLTQLKVRRGQQAPPGTAPPPPLQPQRGITRTRLTRAGTMPWLLRITPGRVARPRASRAGRTPKRPPGKTGR